MRSGGIGISSTLNLTSHVFKFQHIFHFSLTIFKLILTRFDTIIQNEMRTRTKAELQSIRERLSTFLVNALNWTNEVVKGKINIEEVVFCGLFWVVEYSRKECNNVNSIIRWCVFNQLSMCEYIFSLTYNRYFQISYTSSRFDVVHYNWTNTAKIILL